MGTKVQGGPGVSEASRFVVGVSLTLLLGKFVFFFFGSCLVLFCTTTTHHLGSMHSIQARARDAVGDR
jgi:hypothetical protein